MDTALSDRGQALRSLPRLQLLQQKAKQSRELLDEPKGCIESERALNRDGWLAIAISEHPLAKGV